MWHGYRDVCMSPKQTGQFERDIFSTHCNRYKKIYLISNLKTFSGQIIYSLNPCSLISLTRCPLVFSCSGKHMLHTSQWKKLLRPPIRQIPHPSQWYWSLSSSSNKLHIKHVYCKRNDKFKFNVFIERISHFVLTFPNLTPQFSHSACTFCRVSHCVQISSVNVFRSKWCCSFSSWQYLQL